MDFEAFVSIALGFFVPAAVSYLKNTAWDKWKRIALAGALSFVAASASLFVQGELDSFKDLATNSAVVWAVATANYKLWFGNTELNLRLEESGVGGSA